MKTRSDKKWQFKARFRRNAFGWRSQPAIQRVKEAVSEIKKVARKDKVLAAEGAILFLEKVSPALERVDSSSGAIGTAVNKAIVALVEIIAAAPVEEKIRQKWLERLFDAHEADKMPYIEALTDYWGTLCVSKEIASAWADELLWVTTQALSSDPNMRGFFHGTTACLGALFKSERYDEIIEIVGPKNLWDYKRWVMKALAAKGEKSEAIRYAEQSRDPWANDHDINQLCEETLLSSGLVEEAYTRYGLEANRRGTYLAWFRAVTKKYPHKQPAEILEDLVKLTPTEKGKWFAAAKDAGLFDEAIALASSTPCDPRTLTRAARDYATNNPKFAVGAGVAALRWLAQGYGYEITGDDVAKAYQYTAEAAEHAGDVEEILDWVREVIKHETSGECFAAQMVDRHLGIRR